MAETLSGGTYTPTTYHPLAPNVSIKRTALGPKLAMPSTYHHRWELPGNYSVFTMVMVIYYYFERIWRVLVTPDFVYNIYDHE